MEVVVILPSRANDNVAGGEGEYTRKIRHQIVLPAPGPLVSTNVIDDFRFLLPLSLSLLGRVSLLTLSHEGSLSYSVLVTLSGQGSIASKKKMDTNL